MDWNTFIKNEQENLYFEALSKFVEKERETKNIYPAMENVFKAFELTPFDNVKCVIVGQDPYHQPNQAIGLAFAVKKGIKVPPSLKNIYKELESDLNIKTPDHGDISSWARNGVFLINTILTVEDSHPLSHKNKGWETFTLKALKLLNNDNNPKVFILWGKEAWSLKKVLINPLHLVIEGNHPSPLSAYRGFFGSKPFSKTNEFLKNNGREEIDWSIE